MTRVDSKSSNPDLLTVAFADEQRSTAIMLNRSTEPQRVALDWQGQQWIEMERTNQRLENAVSSSLPAELVIEPGEIVTLSNFVAK